MVILLLLFLALISIGSILFLKKFSVIELPFSLFYILSLFFLEIIFYQFIESHSLPFYRFLPYLQNQDNIYFVGN